MTIIFPTHDGHQNDNDHGNEHHEQEKCMRNAFVRRYPRSL